MSIIPPLHRPLQQFYRSGPMPCPYLPGRIERKLFTRLSGPYAVEVNSTLSMAGFRRSHDIIYRPVCPNCHACVPVRIPVAQFVPSRSLRRVLKVNGDVMVGLVPSVATTEQYRLFIQYQSSRHDDSDMARMAMGDFTAMIDEGQADTYLLEARDTRDQLVGAMLTDRLTDGYSAVYSFFDTRQEQRSFGSFLILMLIQQAIAEGLPYVYLGYWIAKSRKMAYKARFQPLEALGPEGWYPLSILERG
jgi:arginyl-tRNA--protein-N-Asp/Glu arginylyltransferase